MNLILVYLFITFWQNDVSLLLKPWLSMWKMEASQACVWTLTVLVLHFRLSSFCFFYVIYREKWGSSSREEVNINPNNSTVTYNNNNIAIRRTSKGKKSSFCPDTGDWALKVAVTETHRKWDLPPVIQLVWWVLSWDTSPSLASWTDKTVKTVPLWVRSRLRNISRALVTANHISQSVNITRHCSNRRTRKKCLKNMDTCSIVCQNLWDVTL